MSPIQIIVRMLEPDCFLQYRMHCATRNFITSGKSHICISARPVAAGYVNIYICCSAAARRGFEMILFTASRGNTFV